jgi:hypothetical protein
VPSPDEVPDKPAPDPETAARQLAELTEQLGLYDDTPLAQEMPPAVNADVPLAQEMPQAPAGKRCPFCGAPMPCAPHRPGG